MPRSHHRNPMKSVVVLTPWFPNRPGDSAGAFVGNSALAVSRAGWRVGALVVRPWMPRSLRRFANNMARGDLSTEAFPLAALATVRVPTLPRLMLRSLTDTVSDGIIARALDHMARSIAADIIHVQTEGFGPIAAQVARRLGLPSVVTLHGINTHPQYLHASYQKARMRSGLMAADRVILVGDPLREFFKSYIGSDEKFQVVPNGIDLPPARPGKPIFENRPRRLVSVANLQEGKGIDLTLRALARLTSEGVSDWTYRIIGEGRERAALLKLTADLGLSDKVTFVGAIRHAEIFDALGSEDIFVLPSYREAFGIAYLEAMAVGLLTIGVMGQGPSQFIRDGENGILLAPGDVEALVAALRDVLTGDCQRWRKVAREGQRTAQNAYTWDHHARQLVSVYEQAIREKISR
jgi:glycosyltransferase involved in cell wall biosynthesis